MGFKNREIEKKLYTESLTLHQVANILQNYAERNDYTGFLAGTGTDYYFSISGKPNSFFRVRERDGVRQLTYKEEDKGGSFDRFEGDLNCFSPLADCLEVAEKQYGKQQGQIFKFFYVYYFNNSKWDTICCYSTIINQKNLESRIFIEVEGRNYTWIMETVDQLKNLIPDIKEAPGSLWTMYLKPSSKSKRSPEDETK